MKPALSYVVLFLVLLIPITSIYYFYKLIDAPESYTYTSSKTEYKDGTNTKVIVDEGDSENILLEYKIPILMYHYVEYNKNEEDFLRDQINIEPHIFEQQIIDLKDAGYEFMFMSEIADIVSSSGPLMGKYVVITFDDGYRDFYTDVYPILQKHKIKSVIYIVSNYVNRDNYMYDGQIREVLQSGLVELGSHTVSHSNLSQSSEFRIENEINQSKRDLETMFLQEVVSFAYPYGAYNDTAVELAEAAGYSNAVTTELGNTANKNKLYKLPRIRPGYSTGNNLIQLIESN